MKRSLLVILSLAALATACKRNETPAAPAPGAPGVPTPGMAGPVAAGGGSCARYAACCGALASNPQFASLAPACAQAGQLAAMGPQGETACGQALSGLRTGMSSMPGGAPAACGGGAAPTAMGAPPAPAMPMPMPTPMPTAAVPAAAGGSCAQFAACCNAAAANPQFAALAPSCAQAGQLAALGPQGDSACGQLLNTIRMGMAAMPGGAPAACGGGGGAAAPMAAGMPAVGAAPTAAAGGAGFPMGTIGVGATMAGSLVPGQPAVTVDGAQHLADDFGIALTAGQPVTIVVRGGPTGTGSTLDVLTLLICNGAEVARDDDSAGNLNSRIVYTPTATGQCTIRVTTFSESANGPYTVQTYAGALNDQT